MRFGVSRRPAERGNKARGHTRPPGSAPSPTGGHRAGAAWVRVSLWAATRGRRRGRGSHGLPAPRVAAPGRVSVPRPWGVSHALAAETLPQRGAGPSRVPPARVLGPAGPSGAGLCGPARPLPLSRPAPPPPTPGLSPASVPPTATSFPWSLCARPGAPSRSSPADFVVGAPSTDTLLWSGPAWPFLLLRSVYTAGRVGGRAGVTTWDRLPSPVARKKLLVPETQSFTPHPGLRSQSVRTAGSVSWWCAGLWWASEGDALLSTGRLALGSSSCGHEGPGPGVRGLNF